MISLQSYQSIEDAWAAGLGDWCRAASAAAFGGTQTWLIPASDGQAGWIKRRLLSHGVSTFGLHLLDPRGLRAELCARFGVAGPVLGEETLSLLLQLYARRRPEPEAAAMARRPRASLEALDDLAAAGWLDAPDAPSDLLPGPLLDWAPDARASGFWLPQTDRLLRRAAQSPAHAPPLAVCVVGWDAARWPLRDLLLAALRAGDSGAVFLPLPREPAAALQRTWLSELEAEFSAEFRVCPSTGFTSAQAVLASRLEGADLEPVNPPAPELLVGADWVDTTAVVREFAARWLIANEGRTLPGGEPTRLAVLCPRRGASGIALLRALAEAGIPAEDGLGELPEPSPARQILRALLSFHANEARVDSLLTLIELLNVHALAAGEPPPPLLRAVFPLDPVEVRRALQTAFADCQQDSARALAASEPFRRAPVAEPLRTLLEHLAEWPEELSFAAALARWEAELTGLGLTVEPLEPYWSQAARLEVEDPTTSAAFFQWLIVILSRPSARRAPEDQRFARVAVTTLQNAAGQTWGGAVFLDSHEGAWPLYAAENPLLDDRARRRLNSLRLANQLGAAPPECGYLLTSADRAHLEQTQLCELLENCDGPLAFAGPAHDPTEPGKELYPNEWALRCMVESARGAGGEERLLDRWRRAVRTTPAGADPKPTREGDRLRQVFARRRDAGAPFDEFGFNFEALQAVDELPLDDAWSARDLDDFGARPATFALARVFGAEPWRHSGARLARAENWAVGRLVHRWIKGSLGASREPRRFGLHDWKMAHTEGIERVRGRSRAELAARLGRAGDALPLWWEGVLRKAEWATRRCLDSLAEAAANRGGAEQWITVDKHFSANLATPGGPLRLHALCDVAVLDRRGFSAAVCHVLDIKTGAQPRAAAITAAHLDAGTGLGLAALLLLAREEGAAAEGLKVGVIHPEATNLSALAPGAAEALGAQLGRIALRQRALIFGQRAAVSARDYERGEDLPMATTPIAASILRAKERLTDARCGSYGDPIPIE